MGDEPLVGDPLASVRCRHGRLFLACPLPDCADQNAWLASQRLALEEHQRSLYELRDVDEAEHRRMALRIAQGLDVPPWVLGSEFPRPRFARLRWRLRRWWSVW